MCRIKKIQCIILTVSIIALSVFLTADVVSSGKRMNSLSLSEQAYLKIKDNRLRSPTKLEGEVIFNDYALVLDKATNTYYYSVIEDSPFAYNPVVQVKGFGQKAKVAFKNAEINDEFIKNNGDIFFTVYTDKYYAEFVLKATTLPIISITVTDDSENIKNPITSDTVYVPATFSVFDNSAEANHINRITESDGSIRLRGATSQGYPKKSYRFQLTTHSLGGSVRNNDVSLLGLRSDDDWILYPAFNDPEKVRNSFSMDVWNMIGGTNNDFSMTTACESKMCEVLINGSYFGLYSLMYPVDQTQFNLSENPSTGKSDFWWRSVGYEHCRSEAFQNAKDDVLRVGRFMIRYPADPTGLGYKKWEVIDALNELLETDDEDFFAKNFKNVIDLDNQIDLWLFLKITQATDTCGKNTNYVAKYRDGKYTIYCSPWDLDQTWGLCWKTGVFTNTDIIVEPDDMINRYDFYMIISRCMEMKMTNVAKQVMSRYEYLRSEVLTDQKLNEMLDYYEEKVYFSGAALRDAQRWPTAKKADDMSDLRRRVIEHMAATDRYIAALDVTFGEV